MVEDHVLDIEDFIFDPVDDIPVRLLILVIVDCRHDIVPVPEPVFVPGQLIPEDGSVGMLGKAGVGLLQFLAVRLHPAHAAGDLVVFRKLIVLDLIRNLVRNQFPALSPVIGDRIGVEIADILLFLPHVFQGLLQQLVHQAHIGVFRVGPHSRQAAHGIGLPKNLDAHRIDRHLGNQGVAVKPADHVRFLHGWKFRPDDLLLLPAHGTELLIRHLEYIAQQGVILFQILIAYRPHFQIFFIHQESPNSPFHTKYIHRYSIGEVQIKDKPPHGPTQSQLSQSRITPQQDSAARNPEAAALLGLSTVAILIEPKRPEPLPQSAGRIIAFPPGQALQDGRFDLIPIFHPQKKQD